MGERPERQLIWHRSRHCEGGACAEVASDGENILIQTSTSRGKTPFILSFSKWRKFVTQNKGKSGFS